MTQKHVNTPKQLRSQQTMNKMLEAAEQILETKSWQTLTIQEVVKVAGTSVGAFYGRFKDKDGLLHALDERYFDTLIGMIESTVGQPQWASMNLPETIYQLAAMIVDIHQKKQGVLRTLIMQARLEDDPRFREREARLLQFLPQVMSIILAHQAEITHEDRETAVKFAILQMFYTVREMTIWSHLTSRMPYQNASLSIAIAQACLGYLTNP